MIIIGIDPGTATTGYGIIKAKNLKRKAKNNLKCLGYGCIKTSPEFSDGERLKKINQELNKIIRKYKPKVLAVENVYFFKNLKTAMPVSQAKGVILFTASRKKIPIYEFTPPQVKMAITGYGRAEKKEIQKTIKSILNLKEIPKSDDAADALAIAVCYTILVKTS
ncbi:crossover junction endodeoxyribonuclease RuvC [Candidatus Parcubacteria bacterium]|nr:crossover junction endodeoxyribonuclease RuvC [Candidatus Parcubacteria bacterium]